MDSLKNSLKEYYDIYDDFEINGYNFPLYAKSLVRNERYIATRKLVIDAYENHQHMFIQFKNQNVEKNDIENFINFLLSTINQLVNPNEYHMSTIINGIFITNRIFTSDAINLGKKFKYRKTFSFGFKGWCDIGIILVELENKKIYTNKLGNNTKSLYQSIMK